MVDSIFTFYGITAAMVGRGAQAPLHISAKLDVFPLNFLAERNRALRALASFFGARFVKKPFEMVRVFSCDKGTIRFVEILSG
jgi:hypothetical protein